MEGGASSKMWMNGASSSVAADPSATSNNCDATAVDGIAVLELGDNAVAQHRWFTWRMIIAHR